jgi:hypothetical protein
MSPRAPRSPCRGWSRGYTFLPGLKLTLKLLLVLALPAPGSLHFEISTYCPFPNLVISSFTRALCLAHSHGSHSHHQVVENRFIGPSAHLTNRDAIQPSPLDFLASFHGPRQLHRPPDTASGTCQPDNMGSQTRGPRSGSHAI